MRLDVEAAVIVLVVAAGIVCGSSATVLGNSSRASGLGVYFRLNLIWNHRLIPRASPGSLFELKEEVHLVGRLGPFGLDPWVRHRLGLDLGRLSEAGER